MSQKKSKLKIGCVIVSVSATLGGCGGAIDDNTGVVGTGGSPAVGGGLVGTGGFVGTAPVGGSGGYPPVIGGAPGGGGYQPGTGGSGPDGAGGTLHCFPMRCPGSGGFGGFFPGVPPIDLGGQGPELGGANDQ